jgi:Family of unknown function (DUF5692)
MSNNDLGHVFITLASMCFAYLVIKQSMSLRKYLFTKFDSTLAVFVIFCLVVPIAMLCTKSFDYALSDESTFLVVKMLSLIVFVAVMNYYMARGKIGRFGSCLILLLIVVNIGEACVTQLRNKPEFDSISEVPEANIVNAVSGILMIVGLFVMMLKARSKVSVSSGQVSLVNNIPIFFIVAYTAWNLLFRIQLIENESTLLFFGVSLLLPIIMAATGTGDWVYTRVYSLLIVMIITFGFGPVPIIPDYTKVGYSENPQSLIVRLQKSKATKILLLVVSFIFSLLFLLRVISDR